LSFFFLKSGFPQDFPIRSVRVKIVADEEFRMEESCIVLGLTSPFYLKNDLLGVASYLNGFVLLRKIDSKAIFTSLRAGMKRR